VDFVPASVVENLRILALVADPPELRPGTTSVTVTAITAMPPTSADPLGATPATQDWSFCPLSAGAASGYACAVPHDRFPACEQVHLASGSSVTLDPLALVTACVASLGGSLPASPPGSALPDQVEVLVRYAATYTTTLGVTTTRTAVQRIPLWLRVPPPGADPVNRPPVISEVIIGGSTAVEGAVSGTVPRGASLAITAAIDPASVDTYHDAVGSQLTESVVVSFFTTAGRFSVERGLDPLAATELQAIDLPPAAVPPVPLAALVWVVARDLRGGEAVKGPYQVNITP
jgi:hypothetical protein